MLELLAWPWIELAVPAPDPQPPVMPQYDGLWQFSFPVFERVHQVIFAVRWMLASLQPHIGWEGVWTDWQLSPSIAGSSRVPWEQVIYCEDPSLVGSERPIPNWLRTYCPWIDLKTKQGWVRTLGSFWRWCRLIVNQFNQFNLALMLCCVSVTLSSRWTRLMIKFFVIEVSYGPLKLEYTQKSSSFSLIVLSYRVTQMTDMQTKINCPIFS